MSAIILQFPQRPRHCIRIEREDPAWLVIRGNHGWLHGSRRAALDEARELAAADNVLIVVKP